MAATGQEMAGKNTLQGLGKVREFYFESGKIDILKENQGKLLVTRLYHRRLEERYGDTVIQRFFPVMTK